MSGGERLTPRTVLRLPLLLLLSLLAVQARDAAAPSLSLLSEKPPFVPAIPESDYGKVQEFLSAPIAFIHVGKAAGGSVRSQLEYRIPRGPEGARWEDQFHLERPRQEDIDDRVVLIMTRDPVKRWISAFNWRQGPLLGKRQTSQEYLDGYSADELNFYNCFTCPSEVVAALEDDDACGDLARASFKPAEADFATESARHLSHVNMNQEFYTSHLDLSRAKGVFTANPDTLQLDANCFLYAVTGTWSKSQLGRAHPASHAAASPSEAEQAIMREHLKSEYREIERLERESLHCSEL